MINVPVKVSLENTGDFDLEDVKLTVSVYDLDAYARSTIDVIKKGAEKSKTLYIELPEDAKSGVYDLKIEASNGDVSRVIYREITVN
jgi:uncharacterized membrane protein